MIKVLNLSVIFDSSNTEHIDYYNSLREKLKSQKYSNYKINLFENKIDKNNINCIIVISENIKKSIKEFNLEEMKRENVILYIVTGNLSTNHIVDCITFTPHLSYLKSSCTRIIPKIINIAKMNGHEKE